MFQKKRRVSRRKKRSGARSSSARIFSGVLSQAATQFSGSQVKTDGPRETRGIEAAKHSDVSVEEHRILVCVASVSIAKIGPDSNQRELGVINTCSGERKEGRKKDLVRDRRRLVASAVWPVRPSLSPRWPPDSPPSFASGKNSVDDGLNKRFRLSQSLLHRTFFLLAPNEDGDTWLPSN